MSGQINIAIRADAGHAIGTGHFGRAAAVAQALGLYDDVRVTLVTTQSAAGMITAYFPPAVGTVVLPDADCAPQAVLTALCQGGHGPDAVYLDQYGALPAWEEATAAAGVPLIVLDDLAAADRAEWIIRPVAGDTATPQANLFEGPAYLPLTADVTAARRIHHAHPPQVHCINVCFGGSDPTGETLKALEALSTFDGIEVDVVIGPRTKITATDLAPFTACTHLRLHHAPTPGETVKLLQNADLAMGAGGVMQWERMCIGVPSLVVTVADNQNQQVAWMAANGAISWLGHHDDVTPAMMRAAISALINDPATRTDMAQQGAALVDGRGAMRVAALARAACLSVRPVGPADARDLYDWRTHALNWQFNLSGDDKPDFRSHVAWLDAKLADPQCQFMIIAQGQTAVAVVRFDITADGGRAALSIYLVPAHHGRKLGLAVYFAAERALRLAHPSVAEVTSDIHARNTGSQRLHKDAGFVLAPTDNPDWMAAQRRF